MNMSDLAALRGYVSALPTPFTNGIIDDDAFQSFCEWQIDEGISALVVNGTTGEAPTLFPEEQEHTIRLAIEAARDRVPVIAGAGSNATSHAVELAQRAQWAGADALLVVTPYYNKPSQEGLYRHFRAIHDACDIPLILYDVPSRTACSLAIDTIYRLAEQPRIGGLKDATGDLARPPLMRRAVGERFRLFSGDDATALDYLGLGGNGCISVLSNVAPRECSRLFKAVDSGAQVAARVFERRLRPVTAALFLESNPVPLKWALNLIGRMGPELRLPLCEPSGETRKAIRRALAQAGLIGPNLVRDAAMAELDER